jgi:hypothetical protein
MYLSILGKQKANPKTSRRKEIIKMRDEIHEMEAKRTIQRISETVCSLKR